ncbi:MAG: glycosyltransferase [Myxococcales bacterium]
MRIALFCHSLLSDWNHGNAHFLRGVATELVARGHLVSVYEPKEAWSVTNLVAERGEAPLARVREVYPAIDPVRYDPERLDLQEAVADADVVIVHEWSDPSLVGRLGALRAAGGRFRLLFHDTHHRSASAPHEIGRYDLSGYDGVLAFGRVVRDLYLNNGWAQKAWTWHEAADTRVFHPRVERKQWDLVWVGNWGDGERTAELNEFLLQPVKDLGLHAIVHGVRYPEHAIAALHDAGIEYGGWLPNFEAPSLFARARVTVHVPRGPYVRALPGIPTIRPFEALACGIPLVSAPWDDVERLFEPGKDYLVARDGNEMKQHLSALLRDSELRSRLAQHGLQTIRARHTCAHRVDEFLEICASLGIAVRERAIA